MDNMGRAKQNTVRQWEEIPQLIFCLWMANLCGTHFFRVLRTETRFYKPEKSFESEVAVTAAVIEEIQQRTILQEAHLIADSIGILAQLPVKGSGNGNDFMEYVSLRNHVLQSLMNQKFYSE